MIPFACLDYVYVLKKRRVENMEQAIEKAHSLATAGDIVSLSPACASFDQFPSYEVRGREFKKKVMSLK